MAERPTTASAAPAAVLHSAPDEGLLVEEKAGVVMKLHRKQRLEGIIRKRTANLSYLKKVHQGGCFWLNVFLFSEEEIDKYVASKVPKQRTEAYFHLGYSLSAVLRQAPGPPKVKAFCQLLEEWEFYQSGGAMQSMKLVMAKNSTCLYPQVMNSLEEAAPNLNDKPSVYKFQNTVVFEYLKIAHAPFQLSYIQVVIALFDSLSELYEGFGHSECYTNAAVYEAIVRLDLRIKHHVINLIAKELTALSIAKVSITTGRGPQPVSIPDSMTAVAMLPSTSV